MNKIFVFSVASVFFGMFPIRGYAQDPAVNLVLQEEYEYVVNATRASEDEDIINEGQLTTSAIVIGDFGGAGRLSSMVNYRADYINFGKESQPDDGRLYGTANIVAGAPSDPVELKLLHERRQLLKDLSDPDININQEDRDTFGAEFQIRSRRASANALSLTLQHFVSKFDEAILSDTERSTLEFQYSRRASMLNTFGLSAATTRVEYVNFSPADYDLTVLYGFFSRTLRQMDYFLAIGANAVTDVGRSESFSPYVQADLSREVSGSKLSVGVSSKVVDNSNVGGANFSDEFDPNDSTGGTVGGGNLNLRERFNHTAGYLQWQNEGALCRHCNIRLRGEIYRDEYEGIRSLADERVARLRLWLGYRYSSRSTIALVAQHADRQFLNSESASQDFVENDIGIDWQKSIGKHLKIFAHIRAEERNFDGDGSYAVEYYGVGIRYARF